MVFFFFFFFFVESNFLSPYLIFNFFYDLLLNFLNFLLNRKDQNIWIFVFFLMFFEYFFIKKN